jgi:hypothetical protein
MASSAARGQAKVTLSSPKKSKWFVLAEREAHKKRPRLDNVLTQLLRAQEHGDPHAAYALGTWYFYGHVVPKNVSKGVALLRKAALAGVAAAAHELAVSYEVAREVKQNTRQALKYYLRAALSGDMQSAYEVGRCYYYGIGCAADRAVGGIWVHWACLQGASEKGAAKSSLTYRLWRRARRSAALRPAASRRARRR